MATRALKRRRRISLTSLIDVIFLLLLFFMLTSTFSQFVELELPLGSRSSSILIEERTLLFLKASTNEVTINGRALNLEGMDAIKALIPEGKKAQLLISMDESFTSQGLIDILAAFQSMPDLAIAILGVPE